MGYTTDFEGEFKLDRPLTPEHAAYLKAFCKTRRMKRSPEIAETFPDPIRVAVGLPIGEQGAYFVGGTGLHGQDHDPSIQDYNREPAGQPGLWCQWIPSDDGTAISWDGVEKFYSYVEWIRYLIDHFLKQWGYVLNGEVRWQGEEPDDIGKIVVKDNAVSREEWKAVRKQRACPHCGEALD